MKFQPTVLTHGLGNEAYDYIDYVKVCWIFISLSNNNDLYVLYFDFLCLRVVQSLRMDKLLSSYIVVKTFWGLLISTNQDKAKQDLGRCKDLILYLHPFCITLVHSKILLFFCFSDSQRVKKFLTSSFSTATINAMLHSFTW